jgi:hypothetical protein
MQLTGAFDKIFAVAESWSTKSHEDDARRRSGTRRRFPVQNFRASAARFF